MMKNNVFRCNKKVKIWVWIHIFLTILHHDIYKSWNDTRLCRNYKLL